LPDLAGNRQRLFVELDGPPRVPQLRVGNAQVAEVPSLGTTIAQAPCGSHGGAEPDDPFTREQAQIEDKRTGIRVAAHQSGGGIILVGAGRGPRLAGPDVLPLGLEEP